MRGQTFVNQQTIFDVAQDKEHRCATTHVTLVVVSPFLSCRRLAVSVLRAPNSGQNGNEYGRLIGLTMATTREYEIAS